MENTQKRNLYKKIQDVSNEIKNIEKNMQVGKGQYSYKAVSDLDVVLAVKEAETKHKLVSIPIKQELVKSEIVKTQQDNGKESINYVDIIKMTVRVIDLEDINSFIEVEAFGRGLDTFDKGFGKASTYARKYALLNVYKIATGEDPDKEKSVTQTAIPENRIQDAVFNYFMKDNNFHMNVLRNFNVGCKEDLDKKQILYIYNVLKNRGQL